MTGEQALKKQSSEPKEDHPGEKAILLASKDLERFAVLVVQIDTTAAIPDKPEGDGVNSISPRLAKVLDGMGKTQPITSIQLSDKRFALLCPDMDEAGAITFAKEIQRRFALITKETVSIGLGVYPFWPFEKDTILANAQKAIDHAAFFGANTVTPFDAVSLNISADKIYQYGDIDGAIDEFRKALMVDADNVNVHNSLGVCYGVQGNYDQAIDSFQTALQLKPDDVMATYNLGLAHLKKEDRDKALDLFLKAYDLDDSHPDIACHIGMCYQETGDMETAISYLEKGKKHHPKGPHLYRALAECYVAVEDYKLACKAYTKALRQHPTDAKSLNALGHLYGVLGENLEIAIVLAREGTTIEPNNGLYRKRLAELYLQAGQPDKALEELEKAQDLGEECGDLLEKARSGAIVSHHG